MNRSLWAACAAILLAGTLTACSTTPANDTNSSGNNTNSGTGSSSMDTTNGSNGSGNTGSTNGNNNSGNNPSNNSGNTDVTNGTNNSGNTNGTGGNGSGSTANSGGMNSTGGTPSGTSYAVPRRTHYPNGADQDRASYNRMTSNRNRTVARSGGRSDGLYTAYSDGYVYPGSNAMTSNNGSGLVQDVTRTARDMVTGVGDMFRDAGDAVRNVTGGINDTRQATAGQTNASQRMGNNARNTMLNVNAE